MKPDLEVAFGSPLFLSDVRSYIAIMEKEKTQLDRFKEAAREIGTDDDEARFDEKLGKLVKPKPTPDPKEHE